MESYREQLAEVFIKPIRSVLIVDDRFPMLDSFLQIDSPGECAGGSNATLAEERKLDVSNAEYARLSALLAFCRDKKRHWLVDVHDGKGLVDPASLPFSSLRQCDLLVLDYNLDGDNMDGGQAIEIVRQLAASDNFNLAIVYTSQDVREVFEEVGVSLSSKIRGAKPISAKDRKSIEEALDAAEDFDENIRQKLSRMVAHGFCVELERSGGVSTVKGKALLAPIFAMLSMEPFGDEKLKHLLVKMLLADFVGSLPSNVTFDVRFADADDSLKWLIAGNAFVVIISKTHVSPADLVDQLMKALEEWRPSPNRLIFAKLRAVLEASGLAPEAEIFQDRPLQAFWLNNLLQAAENERSYHIGSLLDRQMELLTDALRENVVEFTQRVVATSLSGPSNSIEVTRSFLRIDPSDAEKQSLGRISHNTHVSTKLPSGKNLVPGHVLKVGLKNAEYWVCLSPACDLEAGREGGRDFKKRVNPWMPFTALKIFPIADAQSALELATRGCVLFLQIDGKKKQFSYFQDTDKPDTNPVWEEFLAMREGRLHDGFEIELARVEKIPASEHNRDGILPKYERCKATIVAQLRSEYASSLTLRLANHLSRIGLDYIGHDKLRSPGVDRD